MESGEASYAEIEAAQESARNELIRNAIRKAGPVGLTIREVAVRNRSFRRLDSIERQIVMDRIVATGFCVAVPMGRTFRYVRTAALPAIPPPAPKKKRKKAPKKRRMQPQHRLLTERKPK